MAEFIRQFIPLVFKAFFAVFAVILFIVFSDDPWAWVVVVTMVVVFAVRYFFKSHRRTV